VSSDLDGERAASDHEDDSGARQSALIGAALYSSSVTWRPHVTVLPESSFCCIAMWTMNRFGVAPCQWFSPGTFAREREGSGAADAAGRSGDERDLAVEPAAHGRTMTLIDSRSAIAR
jgi:hypothetical protein